MLWLKEAVHCSFLLALPDVHIPLWIEREMKLQCPKSINLYAPQRYFTQQNTQKCAFSY